VPADRLFCFRCEAEDSQTPLRVWMDGSGFSLDDVAEAARIGPATVARALRGDRVSASVARALENLTRIPAKTWRPE
jgi:transcriptional regulator with XRE-family HTH domain